MEKRHSVRKNKPCSRVSKSNSPKKCDISDHLQFQRVTRSQKCASPGLLSECSSHCAPSPLSKKTNKKTLKNNSIDNSDNLSKKENDVEKQLVLGGLVEKNITPRPKPNLTTSIDVSNNCSNHVSIDNEEDQIKKRTACHSLVEAMPSQINIGLPKDEESKNKMDKEKTVDNPKHWHMINIDETENLKEKKEKLQEITIINSSAQIDLVSQSCDNSIIYSKEGSCIKSSDLKSISEIEPDCLAINTNNMSVVESKDIPAVTKKEILIECSKDTKLDRHIGLSEADDMKVGKILTDANQEDMNDSELKIISEIDLFNSPESREIDPKQVVMKKKKFIEWSKDTKLDKVSPISILVSEPCDKKMMETSEDKIIISDVKTVSEIDHTNLGNSDRPMAGIIDPKKVVMSKEILIQCSKNKKIEKLIDCSNSSKDKKGDIGLLVVSKPCDMEVDKEMKIQDINVISEINPSTSSVIGLSSIKNDQQDQESKDIEIPKHTDTIFPGKARLPVLQSMIMVRKEDKFQTNNSVINSISTDIIKNYDSTTNSEELKDTDYFNAKEKININNIKIGKASSSEIGVIEVVPTADENLYSGENISLPIDQVDN